MEKHYYKHIIYAVITMLCLPMSVEAQTSQTTHFSQSFPLDDHDIVKEYNYPITIASAICGELGVSQFYYNVTGQTVQTAFLKASNVYDFAIDNDTVFFCGKDNEGNGIIGFFDIQDLFFNGGQFYRANSFPIADNCKASWFNKLVTYRDSTGKRHIVCVGIANSSVNSFPCIVDLFSEQTGAFMAYNAGMVPDLSIVKSMMDIKRFCTANYPAREDTTRDYLPRDYLIVAGTDTSHHLCLRFFNAQDPFLASGPQHTLYIFDEYDSLNYKRILTESLIDPMSDHSIAVASLIHKRWLNLELASVINFSEINIFQLLAGSATSMTRSVDVRTSGCLYIDRLHHFAYNTSLSRFATLYKGLTNLFLNSRSYFLETNNALTVALDLLIGYDGDTVCGDRGFSGFDLFNAKSQYVLFGNCRNDDYRHNVAIETSGQASGCLPQSDASFHILTPPKSHSVSSRVETIGGRNGFIIVPVLRETRNTEDDCTH